MFSFIVSFSIVYHGYVSSLCSAIARRLISDICSICGFISSTQYADYVMSSLSWRSTSTSIYIICVYLELHPIFIPDTSVSILYTPVVVSAVVALASKSMETPYRHLRESWLIPDVVLEEPRRVLEDPWWHPGDPWRSLGRYLEVRVWSPIFPLTRNHYTQRTECT